MDLQFAGSEVPQDLSRFGTIVECQPPRVRLEVPRQNIPKILSDLLSNYNIEDVGVQERPLEDVIAELFSSSSSPSSSGADAANGETAPSVRPPSDGMSDLELEAEQPVDR
jgi:ABC-2 type transport system ATP-binding protein